MSRPVDAAYDRVQASATMTLLDALRLAHQVECPVTGTVIIDGEEVSSGAWDAMAMAWDGSADGLEDMGYSDAADAMRDEEVAS